MGELSRAAKAYEQSITIAKKLVMLDPTKYSVADSDLIDFTRQIELARR